MLHHLLQRQLSLYVRLRVWQYKEMKKMYDFLQVMGKTARKLYEVRKSI